MVCVCVRQRQVNTEKYGPTLADVEKQIAAHNILHKEIEAFNSQMSPGTASSKVTELCNRVCLLNHYLWYGMV